MSTLIQKKPNKFREVLVMIPLIIILFFSRIVDAIFLIAYCIWWIGVLAISGRQQMGLLITRYGKKQFESTLTEKEKAPIKIPKFRKKYGW